MPSQPVREPDENGGTDKLSLHAHRTTSNITILPNELLMHIAGYLAFDHIQYLDQASFHTYKEIQKDLWSVCLVSKQMEPVARQYLYRAVMVNNVDVLVYLVRTLSENWALGQYVRRIVFDVPFAFEDLHYRRPNVAVLESAQRFSRICKVAVEASDFARYQQELLSAQGISVSRGRNILYPTFNKWAWRRECDILGELHFEILLRSSNLESLCFGTISQSFYPYIALFSQIEPAIDGNWGYRKVPEFMSKLQKLQLLGDSRDGPFSTTFVRGLLAIPSLQTLEFFYDNGAWFRLDPDQEFQSRAPQPSSWQYQNITCIDLQRSKCTPSAIFRICATFPCLKHLLVSVEHGSAATSYHDPDTNGFGTRTFLSTGLAKVEHLQELVLNLHYKHDVKPMLGEHGVLNLGGLNKLTKLRLPLHFLVETQPGNQPFITNLAVVLPASVQHLTVWADVDSVRTWGRRATLLGAGPPPMTSFPYHPRQLAVDFMDSVSGLLQGHFEHLKEVTYCYADQALDKACHCNADILCNRCEASQLLEIHATDDSATRMQILNSIAEIRGVSLCALQEQFAG